MACEPYRKPTQVMAVLAIFEKNEDEEPKVYTSLFHLNLHYKKRNNRKAINNARNQSNS